MKHAVTCPFCGVSTAHEMSYSLQSYVCEGCHNLIESGLDDCCLFFAHDIACLCQKEKERERQKEKIEEEEYQSLCIDRTKVN
ncbi:hypothetical protein PsalMR5_04903 (plasmid) [Piscirickettsia salmonis]|uniref:hypothetical protein n=1 Tax=Piscirickettsia salmonis TaxID=1238 RepID=UPI0012BA5E3F|nr:hypothetical protein [Piscirickettsia salmonis]QGP57383.1 hypothetical protein PsalSR1_04872 [Piscirickettsia salmonis]QGP66978.1 hypothetical protein PsalMR5_04903 [Piscirickettsia salmonis]